MNVQVTLTVTLPGGIFSHTVEVPSHRLLTEDFYRVFQERYAAYLTETHMLGKESSG